MRSTSDKIAVLNVDDQPVWCVGIDTIIGSQPDMLLVAHASTGRHAIANSRVHKPDVILMNFRLPDMSGVEAMIAIRATLPDARFIILTSVARDNEIRLALTKGAHAYMLKSMPHSELVDIIRQVHVGKKKIPLPIAVRLAEHHSAALLTDREVEVLRHLVDGSRNRDIAEKLFIAEETVKAHMKRIMGKLGANRRTEAIVIALRRGLLQL